METIDDFLRGLLGLQRRRGFVITLTCLVAVLGLWPLVDRYLALRDLADSLELELTEAHVQAAEVDKLEEIANRRAAELARWNERIVTEEATYEFRSLLTQLARRSGCRVRRVDVGASTKSKWNGQTPPLLEGSTGQPSADAPYELRQQTVNLSLAGSLPQVLDFLAQLAQDKRFIHHGSFQLNKATSADGGVTLDMELILVESSLARMTSA